MQSVLNEVIPVSLRKEAECVLKSLIECRLKRPKELRQARKIYKNLPFHAFMKVFYDRGGYQQFKRIKKAKIPLEDNYLYGYKHYIYVTFLLEETIPEEIIPSTSTRDENGNTYTILVYPSMEDVVARRAAQAERIEVDRQLARDNGREPRSRNEYNPPPRPVTFSYCIEKSILSVVFDYEVVNPFGFTIAP